ncbi:hypothetical protein OC844_000870 [Tilletia horrida]|nr:hypothetical protein OC844_000870 [Tilletia horrida]
MKLSLLPALLAASLLSAASAFPVKPAPPSAEALRAARRAFDERVATRAQLVARAQPTEFISKEPNYSLFNAFYENGTLPEPIRGSTGASSIGPSNPELDRQNPDSLAPPTTDGGNVPQTKWPFALSHNRLESGGWARQQNVNNLPVATEIAGVNMRLEEGAFRELHWHSTAEWAYVLNGSIRIATTDFEGRTYVNDVGPGDLWYFPSALPHSIQALSKGGAEFLLVFADGSFDENDTLLLSDFVAHIPREVLLKNFGNALNNSALDTFPKNELYIFNAPTPNTTASEDVSEIADPQGTTPSPYTFNLSGIAPTKLPGGSIKIVDSRNFTVSTQIAAAEVTIQPGAIRELHWHPNAEWDFFISGHARITVFAGNANAATFDFQAGDTAYIQQVNGHYIEALGDEPVKYLEVFRAPVYQDVSLSTWLAVTPINVVQAHLGLSRADALALQRAYRLNTHQLTGVSSSNSSATGTNGKRSLPEEDEAASARSRVVAGKRSWA